MRNHPASLWLTSITSLSLTVCWNGESNERLSMAPDSVLASSAAVLLLSLLLSAASAQVPKSPLSAASFWSSYGLQPQHVGARTKLLDPSVSNNFLYQQHQLNQANQAAALAAAAGQMQGRR
ncbi:hypothetical protein TYRP_010277 [Tyrophagus putrescentiae]|nr:hypothetical protein TYRP_010277 [Tyrophagus putrescentiae]